MAKTTVDEELIENIYKRVEDELRDAVQRSKTEVEFRTNLGVCQLYAQRMLAILIFNSSLAQGTETSQMINKITEAIRFEVEEIERAAQEGEENLSAVTAEIKKEGDESAH